MIWVECNVKFFVAVHYDVHFIAKTTSIRLRGQTPAADNHDSTCTSDSLVFPGTIIRKLPSNPDDGYY